MMKPLEWKNRWIVMRRKTRNEIIYLKVPPALPFTKTNLNNF